MTTKNPYSEETQAQLWDWWGWGYRNGKLERGSYSPPAKQEDPDYWAAWERGVAAAIADKAGLPPTEQAPDTTPPKLLSTDALIVQTDVFLQEARRLVFAKAARLEDLSEVGMHILLDALAERRAYRGY